MGKAFFNSTLQFIDGIFLVVATCACINIYRDVLADETADDETTGMNQKSFWFSVGVLVALSVFTLAFGAFLSCNASSLSTEQMVSKYGSVYANMNVKRIARPSVALITCSFTRRLLLATIVTFAMDNLII